MTVKTGDGGENKHRCRADDAMKFALVKRSDRRKSGERGVGKGAGDRHADSDETLCIPMGCSGIPSNGADSVPCMAIPGAVARRTGAGPRCGMQTRSVAESSSADAARGAWRQVDSPNRSTR